VIDSTVIEAAVQVGADVTRYLRCGSGDRVVVVVAGDGEERSRLIARHCGRCRVIAPVIDSAAYAAFPEWLAGVIEGLGLDQPDVVMAADHADLAAGVREWNPAIRVEVEPA
jgi:hypothetical protein